MYKRQYLGVDVTVIVRFVGNIEALGVKTLSDSDVDIIAATGLSDAVQRAVNAAGGK